ncbi:MAG: nitroreductase family protein [Pirellulales bacterium]
MINAAEQRKSDHPIEPLFLERWSPRAMSGAPLSDGEVLTLFEAGRWAPSTYNEQEWRFCYARRDTPQWPLIFDLLIEFNQSWCKNAGMLVVVLAHKVFTLNGKPNPVHMFDAGAAFENIALQGTAMGLVVHGMQGFDYEKARTALEVPEDYAVAAMFAVGKPAPVEVLPEAMREREVPSGRKPLEEITCEGAFSFEA